MAVAIGKPTGFHVYCDESQTDSGKRYMVYGGIILPENNRDRLQREISKWREKHRMTKELAWTKVSNGKYAEYKSLVELFFSLAVVPRLLHFKAIVLDTHSKQYRVFSKGEKELGFYKFYYQFLLHYFAIFPCKYDCCMDVVIDERSVKGNPYEVLKIVLNHGIRKKFRVRRDRDVVTSVEPIVSTTSDFLQLADVLMGAVGFHCLDFHLRPNARKAKVDLAAYIARRLGIRDLKHQTAYNKQYFKIERWVWPGEQQPYPLRRRPADRRLHPKANDFEP